LEQFEQQFKVHTWKWLHVKTIPIIIVGDPSIAKAYICWIFNNDTNFLTKEITLKHHFMGREQIKVKVNEFMHWFISHYSYDERENMQSDGHVQSINRYSYQSSCHAKDLIWHAIAPRAANQQ
jgi:hypothetical protein